MECVACGGATISERRELTVQGYRRFRCRDCGKQFNERTGGSLNRAQYPSDVIALVVFWRLRYKLSLRDLPEMFLLRGIEFTYEAVRDWEAKLTPLLIDNLRRRRGGGSRVRVSWYVDETYIKVHGRWCYLYRAIDRTGALVDVMLSETRDLAAAETFFRSAKAVTGVTPARVTTDGHDSYPRAVRSQLGANVRHRNSQYLNNRIEQDHRGIKSRYGPMRGFGAVSSAARFCRCHDELRNLLHINSHLYQSLPATARRRRFLQRSHIALRVMASS
jgi:putative transposase